jgi:hypothetical protein
MMVTKPGLKTELIFITPEMATAWLEKNINNRKLKKHKIAKLRTDLRCGRFQTTHQGVAFNCNGDLKDGQHRLTAIAQEGIGAWMMVTTGLPNEAVTVIDRGSTRSLQDNAVMSGVDVTIKDVAIAHVAMSAPDSIAHTSSTSEYEVIEFIQNHREAFNAVRVNHKKRLSVAPVMAAFLRAYPYCPNSAWVRCLHLYMNGVDELFDSSKERAIIVFRDFCMTSKGRSYSGSIDLYRRCQRAIKAFMNAEDLKIVKPCDQDLFPLQSEVE